MLESSRLGKGLIFAQTLHLAGLIHLNIRGAVWKATLWEMRKKSRHGSIRACGLSGPNSPGLFIKN
jgi:hypothetical protein